MKKLMLFASLAVAATAFAVPSTASAIWTHNHVHISAGTNPVLHGEGSFNYSTQTGGIECSQVTSTLQLTGGTTTAHITQFTATLANCKTTGGLAGCTITGLTTESFPWTGHISGTTINQTGVTIQTDFSGFLCPTKLQLHTTAQDQITLQPEETGLVGGHTTITGFNLSGPMQVTELGGTATFSGKIALTSSSSHTYGFT
jgi:hypothetical protein